MFRIEVLSLKLKLNYDLRKTADRVKILLVTSVVRTVGASAKNVGFLLLFLNHYKLFGFASREPANGL
jgi:hypothetical protein